MGIDSWFRKAPAGGHADFVTRRDLLKVAGLGLGAHALLAAFPKLIAAFPELRQDSLSDAPLSDPKKESAEGVDRKDVLKASIQEFLDSQYVLFTQLNRRAFDPEKLNIARTLLVVMDVSESPLSVTIEIHRDLTDDSPQAMAEVENAVAKFVMEIPDGRQYDYATDLRDPLLRLLSRYLLPS
jgi:hypothetical protein